MDELEERLKYMCELGDKIENLEWDIAEAEARIKRGLRRAERLVNGLGMLTLIQGGKTESDGMRRIRANMKRAKTRADKVKADRERKNEYEISWIGF